MKPCEFEKYFVDYFLGELDKSEILQLQIHLQECPSCSEGLDQYYSAHQKILHRQRSKPSAGILNDYHQSLNTMFSDVSEKKYFSTKIKEIIGLLIHPKSLPFRLAEVAGLLLIGIVLGWLIFSPVNNQVNTYTIDDRVFLKPISESEIEYLKYYFQAAELLLTEIKNIDQHEGENYTEIEFQKEVAQKLLIKTFLVHEIALRQNDPRMLRFLGKMEIILYEISNLDQDELVNSLPSFTMIIDDTKLIDHARAVENQLKKFSNHSSNNNSTQELLLSTGRSEKPK